MVTKRCCRIPFRRTGAGATALGIEERQRVATMSLLIVISTSMKTFGRLVVALKTFGRLVVALKTCVRLVVALKTCVRLDKP